MAHARGQRGFRRDAANKGARRSGFPNAERHLPPCSAGIFGFAGENVEETENPLAPSTETD